MYSQEVRLNGKSFKKSFSEQGCSSQTCQVTEQMRLQSRMDGACNSTTDPRALLGGCGFRNAVFIRKRFSSHSRILCRSASAGVRQVKQSEKSFGL